MADRKEMLEYYVNNRLFKQLSNLNENELKNINFSDRTEDPLAEALKKLLFSYCRNDADLTVIKNINMELEKFTKG